MPEVDRLFVKIENTIIYDEVNESGEEEQNYIKYNDNEYNLRLAKHRLQTAIEHINKVLGEK